MIPHERKKNSIRIRISLITVPFAFHPDNEVFDNFWGFPEPWIEEG
jgi:hypothetical protein